MLLHADDLADHVGHGGQLLAAHGHGLQRVGAEFQAVQHGAAEPGSGGTTQIALVGRLQCGKVLAQQGGQLGQRLVFERSRRFGHQGRGGFGLAAQRMHQARKIAVLDRGCGEFGRVHTPILPQASMRSFIRGCLDVRIQCRCCSHP